MAQKKGNIELYSPAYYAACAVGGVLSCGLTHMAVTPIDLVKCNAQVDKKNFPGAIAGIRSVYSGKVAHLGFNSGMAGLLKGWGPTLIGYSIQGAFKFGLYELFKHEYARPFGEEKAHQYRTYIYMAGSASAEFFADIGLCPFEAVKVRIQTNPKYARGLMDGFPKMLKEEGWATMYAGIGPLWARQIPYTIIKFVAFERIAEAIYGMLPKKKEDMNKVEQMGVIFSAGYLAGVLCGAVSHPADTMVSKINKIKTSGSVGEKMKLIYSGTPTEPGIGFKGLWAGFGPRVVMIGTLTGLQWFIYGAFKVAIGLPAPGGAPQAKKPAAVAPSAPTKPAAAIAPAAAAAAAPAKKH
jgi:solute carrier family 25 phosphate transporter 3